MNLYLLFKAQLKGLSGTLIDELDQLLLRMNAWGRKEHNSDGTHGTISVDGITFNGTRQTTVGAAGGASAQPATPLGYLLITLPDGTQVAVPYHNAS